MVTAKNGKMAKLLERIPHLARTNARVLITGESGVGKELVARLIHDHSHNARFVSLNCAGLPERLLESELFGHVRGSFAGAFRDKPGLVEAANGGTLLLKEISEIPPRVQGLLSRMLESGEVQKIGETKGSQVSVRVLCTNKRELRQKVNRKLFREDLYYRLNVVQLSIPPLRERPEDIPALIKHFTEVLCLINHKPLVTWDSRAIEMMSRYKWPGNIRELRNTIERLVLTGARVIGADLIARELSFRPIEEVPTLESF